MQWRKYSHLLIQGELHRFKILVQSCSSRLDKKKFLEKHESAFMVPKKFEYQPVRRDETELVQKPVVEVIIEKVWKHNYNI